VILHWTMSCLLATTALKDKKILLKFYHKWLKAMWKSSFTCLSTVSRQNTFCKNVLKWDCFSSFVIFTILEKSSGDKKSAPLTNLTNLHCWIKTWKLVFNNAGKILELPFCEQYPFNEGLYGWSRSAAYWCFCSVIH